MTITVATPITGLVQTGMAAPSFTVVQDSAVNVNSRRWVVTSVSDAGGVSPHSVSSPFQVEITRPAVFKPQPAYDHTGTYAKRLTGKNEFRIRVLKGTVPANGLSDVIDMNLSIRIPSGADSASPTDIRAALSLIGGFLNEDGDGIGDSLVNGVF